MSSNYNVVGFTSMSLTIGGTGMLGISAGPLVSSVLIKLNGVGGTCSLVGQSTISPGYILDANIPLTLGGGAQSIFIKELSGVTSSISILKTLTGFTAY